MTTRERQEINQDQEASPEEAIAFLKEKDITVSKELLPTSLSKAVEDEKEGEKIVKMALAAGQNVNAGNVTLLHHAAFHGKLGIAKLLTENSANLGAIQKASNRTPMFLAVMQGHEEIASYLLSQMITTNPVTGKRELSSLGKEVLSLKDKRGDTLFHQVCRKGMFKLASEIFEVYNPDVLHKNEGGATVLEDACSLGSVPLIQALVARKAKPDADCLFAASSEGKEEAVRYLLQDHKISPNATTRQKRPSLHVAASRGHKAVVTALLEAQAKVDSTHEQKPSKTDLNSHVTTPLMVAAHRGHHEIVLQLLDAKANVNFPESTETALVLASWAILANDQENTQVVETLLKAGAKVNGTDSRGRSALILAANANRVAVVGMLLAAEAGIEEKTKQGHTALFAAVLRRHQKTTEFLLQKGANPNIKDKSGQTLLSEARTKATVNILVKHHAEIEATNDKTEETALIRAAAVHPVSVVEALLDAKAEIEAKTMKSRTALFAAVQANNILTVELLLGRRAQFDVTDYRGNTPLSYAQSGEVKALLQAAAGIKKGPAPSESSLMLSFANNFFGAGLQALKRGQKSTMSTGAKADAKEIKEMEERVEELFELLQRDFNQTRVPVQQPKDQSQPREQPRPSVRSLTSVVMNAGIEYTVIDRFKCFITFKLIKGDVYQCADGYCDKEAIDPLKPPTEKTLAKLEYRTEFREAVTKLIMGAYKGRGFDDAIKTKLAEEFRKLNNDIGWPSEAEPRPPSPGG